MTQTTSCNVWSWLRCPSLDPMRWVSQDLVTSKCCQFSAADGDASQSFTAQFKKAAPSEKGTWLKPSPLSPVHTILMQHKSSSRTCPSEILPPSRRYHCPALTWSVSCSQSSRSSRRRTAAGVTQQSQGGRRRGRGARVGMQKRGRRGRRI